MGFIKNEASFNIHANVLTLIKVKIMRNVVISRFLERCGCVKIYKEKRVTKIRRLITPFTFCQVYQSCRMIINT